MGRWEEGGSRRLGEGVAILSAQNYVIQVLLHARDAPSGANDDDTRVHCREALGLRMRRAVS